MKPEYIGILLFLVAVLGFLFTYFGPIMALKEKVGKITGYNFQGLVDRVGALETKIGTVNLIDVSNRIVAVETKMSIFWDAVGDVVKDIIKQPIHYRKDELVEKFPNLTIEETRELRDILIKERNELKMSNAAKNPSTRAYVLAIGLQLARVQTELMDKESKVL